MQSDVSRRTLLQLAATVATVGFLPRGDSGGALAADDDTDDGADGRIPAPFDEIPTLETPSDDEREFATNFYPDEAVPDSGPIPDPHHCAYSTVEITVPEWAIEATRARVDQSGDLSEWNIEDCFLGHAQPDLEFVTEDGEDAVEVLIERLEGDDDQWE